MLNKYEYVIKTCDYVEQTLVNRFPYIGCYSSFHDKLCHLGGRIPSHILNQLHVVRQQRNYLAHNEEYNFNWPAYDRSLHTVHQWLGMPIIYSVPVEIIPVPVEIIPVPAVVHRETTIAKKNRELDPKDVLLAAGAGLAGLGLASLLVNNKKNPFG